MLPLPARCAAHEVRRARLEIDLPGGPLTGFGWPGTKAKSRVAKERDAQHVLELWHVPVPAEGRRGAVLGDHCVLDALLRNSGPLGKSRPQRQQELRNGWRLRQFLVGEVIAAAEAHDPPSRTPFLVLRFLERQRANDLEQLRFLRNAQELRGVGEPGWPGGRRVEQLRLYHECSMDVRARLA